MQLCSHSRFILLTWDMVVMGAYWPLKHAFPRKSMFILASCFGLTPVPCFISERAESLLWKLLLLLLLSRISRVRLCATP